ncbi:MAG: alpha/beta hydrolase [Oscillospiraceae bacterium]|nr:alpha/beta hydrolase [Oscillospiraceae bacterium]
MKLVEFGAQHTETILLLHGGGLSWWNYREAAGILAEHYHVVLPVLDGHGGSETAFSSMEDNARRLIQLIEERFGGQVRAIGGLSLGGQIAVEMLCQRPDICRFALLESVLVKPMPLTRALIGPAFGMSYGLIRRRWFAKLQAAYLRIPRACFEDYYRDTCAIAKEDMIAFLRANSGYAIKPGLSQTCARVKIVAGSREQRAIVSSAKLLHRAIPGSALELLPGMHHGDLSLNHPQRYAQLLRSWIEEK